MVDSKVMALLNESGVKTTMQARVLFEIIGGLNTVTGIAKSTGLDKATVSRSISAMSDRAPRFSRRKESPALIKTVLCSDDYRIRLIALTDKGHELKEKIYG